MTDDYPVSFSHAGLKTTWRVMPDFEKSTTVKMEPEFFNVGVFVGFSTVHVKSPSKYKSSPEKNVENEVENTVEDKAKDEKDEKIYTFVEQMPEFPGGTHALRKFIGKQLRYPKIAKEDAAQGQILVNFIVNREGNIWNVRILKSAHPALDQEVIRVIYSLPQWKPGVHHGRAVNVEYNIPVSFSYREIYK
ncbi:MAG: energy transducer TonB [Mangrovibacterium sp.]